MPESNFFTEEASRQILLRVASVFNDPDLCDATFIVRGDDGSEEIAAPSQFMAVSSPYFKALFYPPKEGDDKKREVEDMQPKIFRKVLDYLFRGRVPLTSIDDAWRVKVAGRKFELKELEELTTKFLKYRLDSQNLLTYLKSSFRYKCTDLREVVTTRFLKEAIAVLDNPAILDLSQDELLSLVEKEPEVQGKKLMSVLIRWAKKKYVGSGSLAIEEIKKEDDEKPKEGEEKAEEKNVEKTEEKKPEKTEEKKSEEGDDNKKEDKKETEAPKEPEIPNLVTPLQPFMRFIKWDHGDAEFFLKEVRNKNIMMQEDENRALTMMLQSYVDKGLATRNTKGPAPQQAGRKTPVPSVRGRSGARQAPEKGPSGGPDIAIAGEKRGSGGSAYIIDKIDDDIVLD